jgi:hypothetical protein
MWLHVRNLDHEWREWKEIHKLIVVTVPDDVMEPTYVLIKPEF